MNIIKILLLCLLTCVSKMAISSSTYDDAISGKKCQESNNQNLSCSYKVGKTLYIQIAGIGSPDAGIVFLKSDFDGDYYGKYGVMHGCVIVSSASDLLNVAFISPKNGKVYHSW